MEVNGQLHVPADLPPRIVPLISIGWETVWGPEPVWTPWWREKFPASAGTQTPIIQPVTQRYTTELSRILSYEQGKEKF
jgi:hypothetical protein